MTPHSVITLHSPYLPAVISTAEQPNRRAMASKAAAENSVEHILDFNDKALLRPPKDPEPKPTTKEFDEMGLLTQYIELPLEAQESSIQPPRQLIKWPERSKRPYSFTLKQWRKIKGQKATKALENDLVKKHTPAKLRITIIPLVINKEDPMFIREWDQSIKQCKRQLMTNSHFHSTQICS